MNLNLLMQLRYISHKVVNTAVVIPAFEWSKDVNEPYLLYTAVTRARKCVTLVGDEKIFWEMEENQMEQSRYTTLDLRLKEIGLQQEF